MGLVDLGVVKESGRCWPVLSVSLAAGLANGPKSSKVQAYIEDCERFKGNFKYAPSPKDHKHML